MILYISRSRIQYYPLLFSLVCLPSHSLQLLFSPLGAEKSVFVALTAELDVKYVDTGAQYPRGEFWFPQLFLIIKPRKLVRKCLRLDDLI